MLEIGIDTCEELNANENSLIETENLTNSYNIVDTNQTAFYSDKSMITEPSQGEFYYGQDANYTGNIPSYTDNNDGTISDNVTKLMWAKDMGNKTTYDETSGTSEKVQTKLRNSYEY
jgi:hypothetical protein